jgi:hypothetical protein
MLLMNFSKYKEFLRFQSIIANMDHLLWLKAVRAFFQPIKKNAEIILITDYEGLIVVPLRTLEFLAPRLKMRFTVISTIMESW